MKPHPHKKQTGRKAFSLVEVTIAMAIAAVAIVTLLGLIPQGMNTMREAGDEAIQGRIHQQILNTLQMVPFETAGGKSPLDDYNGKEFYYDAQGEELVLGVSEKGSFEHIYTARVSVPLIDGGTPRSVGGAGYRGYSFEGSANPFVRLVIVEVAPVAGLGAEFKFDDPDNFHLISTYQSVVAKMGQDYSFAP